MRVAIRDHQGKSWGLQRAVKQSPHMELVPFVLPEQGGVPVDFLLIDFDGTDYYRHIIDWYDSDGAKILLYPHGALAYLAWDGVYDPHPAVAGFLASSFAQQDIMNTYGYPKDIHVVGWQWTNIFPMQKTHNKHAKLRVLFAPIHPLSNGYLHQDYKDANRQAGELLKPLSDSGQITLQARYMGAWSDNSIPHLDNAKVKQVGVDAPDLIEHINWADVVVANGSLAYYALAIGKPTVMFGQNIHYFDGHSDETVKRAANWDLYRAGLWYKPDFEVGSLGGKRIRELLEMVADGDWAAEVKLWREAHIIGAGLVDEFKLYRVLSKYA